MGRGEVVKLCNTLSAGGVGGAVSEAFRIAEGFGMDPKVVTDVISKSSGNTFLMGFMHPVPGIMPEDLAPQFYDARGERGHEALDIIAMKGEPVVAVEDGRIAKMF